MAKVAPKGKSTTQTVVRTAPAGTSARKAGLTAKDLWRMLRRHLWLIGGIFVGFVVGTILLTVAWLRFMPTWRAEARIVIMGMRTPNPMEPQATAGRTDLQDFIATQASLVKERAVIRRALREPLLRETTWFKRNETKDLLQLEQKLLEEIQVRTIRNTHLIEVSFEYTEKNDVAPVVNSVVKVYLDYIRHQLKQETKSHLVTLQKEEARLKRTMQLRKQELANLSREIPGLGLLQTQLSTVSQRLMDLSKELTKIELYEAVMRQTRAATEQSVTEGRLQPTAEELRNIEADGIVRNLEYSRMQINEQAQQLLEKLDKDHPQIQQLEARKAEVVRQQEKRRAELREQAIEGRLQSVRAAHDNARKQLTDLVEKVTGAEVKQKELDRKVGRFKAAEAEFLDVRQLYSEIASQRRKLDIILAAPDNLSISQAGEAMIPLKPASPDLVINIVVGILLGLVFSVGLALVIELANTSIRSPSDVDRFVSLPTLGCVPRTQDDTQAPESELYTIGSSAPQSLVAEAFRQIRTMLTFSCPAQEQTAVMVTSPSPTDGKTTVAVNLAIAAAQSGQKVLLVDANFRRPALQRIFPNLREEGLSNLLVGQVKMEQAITHTEVPGLDVLSCGATPPNPAELLGSPHMRSFLATATKQYDRIIIDTPPVLLLSDAAALAGVVDGVILVLRAHRNNRGAAARARQVIDSVSGRLFGVVLNAIKVLRGGYLRKSYRQYYDYRQAGAFGAPPMPAPAPEEAPTKAE